MISLLQFNIFINVTLIRVIFNCYPFVWICGGNNKFPSPKRVYYYEEASRPDAGFKLFSKVKGVYLSPSPTRLIDTLMYPVSLLKSTSGFINPNHLCLRT
jgi:hypothetical protein